MRKFLKSRSQKPRHRNWLALIAMLAITAALLRFLALEQSPPGYYVDEAAISTQVLCVADGGTDYYGNSWPLFSPVLGGGYATPVYLYLGAVWSSIFGSSITAFRSFAAAFGLLAILFVFLIANRIWGRSEAWFAALCAAFSPWGFQFSRIAWDPALAPALFMAGIYFILRGGSRPRTEAAIGGILYSLALYSYPPLRVTGVLLFPAILLFLYLTQAREKTEALHRHLFKWRALIFSLVFFVSMIPLIQISLQPEFQARSTMLSVFGDYYLNATGDPSFWRGLRAFFENMMTHFSPRYLFLSGDGNLRHSTQAVGQWSWLEILGIGLFLLIIFKKRAFKNRSEIYFSLLLVYGYISSIVPAALTWESNPHALRSITAWPFLSLLSGFALARFVDWKPKAAPAVGIIALLFAVHFLKDYFLDYPERSAAWFDVPVVELAQRFESENRIAELRPAIKSLQKDYPDLAIHYFEIRGSLKHCQR